MLVTVTLCLSSSFILFVKQKDKTSLCTDEVFLLTVIRYQDDVRNLSEVLETLEFASLVYGNTFALSHYIPSVGFSACVLKH